MRCKSIQYPVSGIQYQILGLFLLFALHGFSKTPLPPPPSLDSANAAYSKGNFVKAAEDYEKIIAAGFESPEVYYNLGNAYYKLDKVGLCILNYERAKKLSPHDEDINFNLKMAGQRTEDKIEPLPKLFLDEWIENLQSMHSEKTWSLRSIVCFALALFFAIIFITSARRFTKQLGFWLGIVFLSFSAFSFFIAKGRYTALREHNSAVIISSSAEIKNAPAETGTKLFMLHEGAVVGAPEENAGWVKIQLTPEKTGWVKRSSIEFI